MKKTACVMIIAVLCFMAAPYVRGQVHELAGTTSASWLKIAVGGRAAGMGESHTAAVKDATAVFWNPANLVLVDSRQLMAQYGMWYAGTDYSAAAFVLPLLDDFYLPVGALGFGVAMFGYGDIRYTTGLSDIEKSEDSLSDADFFTANSMMASVSYSQALGLWFSVGITGKMITETLGNETATTFAGDAGILITQGIEKVLNIAFVMQNMGMTLHGSELPQAMKVGISYEFGGMTAAFDYSMPNDHEPKMSAGLELMLSGIVYLRGGMMMGTDDLGGSMSGMSAGMGFDLNMLKLDVAYVPYGALGDTIRASMLFRF